MERGRVHLSPAGERLLADLMSPSPSLQHLRLDLSECVMQFTAEGPGISMVQLFTAIGNCCTLRTVDLGHVFVNLPSGSGSVYLMTMALLTGLVANPVLEVLDLSGCEAFEEDAACVALAALVRSSSSLHTLGLSSVSMTWRGLGEIGAALPNSRVRVFNLDMTNCGWPEGYTSRDMWAQHMAHIVANTPSLKELGMVDFPLTVSGAKLVADALRHSTTLHHLRIGTILSDWTADTACLSALLAALSSSTSSEGIPKSSAIRNHSIKELRLLSDPVVKPRVGEALVQVLRTNTTLTSLTVSTFFLEPGGGLEALSDNTSITRLRLDLRGESESTTDVLLARLVSILEKRKTLQELDLTMADHVTVPAAAKFGRGLIRSLKHNPRVRVLILDGWHFLDDGLLQDLLESLRYNTNLRRISIEHTPWKRQGKETTIQQALKQVAYLSDLKHADIEFTPPKSGRLFLCGPGYAGKTTLRGSLIGSWKSRASLRKKCIARLRAWDGIMASPRRTEGIEIEVLREDDKMRVTIWDLAGQDTFRILQQHLFPTVSQACIFFLVFSPFDQGTGQVKREWEEDLQVQLRDWLRFITSNTSTKLHGSIEAYVILTHLDKMSDFTSVTMVDFATPSIQTVTRVFDGVLEGGPESVQVFALNCKSERDVAPLLDDVFLRFEQLLGNKLLLVPEPCTDMSIVLAKWTSIHPKQPIMRLEQFRALCRSKVVALQDPAGQDELANRVQDAISSYLHDIGVIMFFEGLDFLVVNPNWVTHILLGQLIKFGCSQMPSTKYGVVTESQLEHVLKEFVKQGRYKGFNEKDLMLLMLKLELCYKEEPDTSGVTRYFVPTTLDDADGKALTGKRPVDWPVYVDPAAKDCIHIGRRLQCKDEIKTVLGPGFFPKLQVRLRNKLFEKKEQIRMAADQYQIQRNLITFHTDGMQVILESPGDIADYVDILVKSIGKTQEQTVGFLMEHVMEEVQSVRESSSPGVVLVEGIIRKACVSKLTLCAHRRNQVVLKQELLSRLEALVDSNQTPLDYWYTWTTKVPETDDLELGCASEKATDLLDPGELWEAVRKKRRSLEQQMTKIVKVAGLVVGETQSNDQPVPRVSPHNQKDPALKPTLSTQMRLGFDDLKDHISIENKKKKKLHNEIHSLSDWQHCWNEVKDGAGCSVLPDGQHLVEVLPDGSKKVPPWHEEDDCYPNDNWKQGISRGMALIVSMEMKRPGAGVDRGSLKALALACGFSPVQQEVDQEASQLIDSIKYVAENRVLEVDEAFMCSINGHGGTQEGQPYLLDENNVKVMVIRDIIEPFRRSKHLLGKPKIFFINCCRGTKLYDNSSVVVEPVHDDHDAQHDEGHDAHDQPETGSLLPDLKELSDCLLVFSTSEGCPSCRSRVRGTIFVENLVETVMEKRHTMDVLNMTMVNKRVTQVPNRVEKVDDGTKTELVVGQCCEVRSFLRKKLYWQGA